MASPIPLSTAVGTGKGRVIPGKNGNALAPLFS
jgi:hypothetical protein